ncbi:MAG: dockerin type I domain-containing protein [Pirellulales bacterium]
MARWATVCVLRLSAVLALVTASTHDVRAVVVSAQDLSVTEVAPADDPGWNNVGRVGAGSGIYLGNRWVLTANHVGDGALRLSDGRSMGIVPGSGTPLTNSGVSAFGSPDLRMFRLASDPGLPAIDIAEQRPVADSSVVMIGAGLDRLPGLIGWQVSGATWNQVALPLANITGYVLGDTHTMRWGANAVVGGSILVQNNTRGFATRFERPGLPFEAQAATGDSGGAVFQKVDGSWELAGVILTQQLLGNQPAGTIVSGDQTQAADLSQYRAQIEALLARIDPAWQNSNNYFDVDGSGIVDPLDAQRIINELIRNNTHALTGAAPAGRFLDVNGDDLVSPLDSQRVINELIRAGAANSPALANPALAAAAAADMLLVPEPSAAFLAALGALVLVMMRAAAPGQQKFLATWKRGDREKQRRRCQARGA